MWLVEGTNHGVSGGGTELPTKAEDAKQGREQDLPIESFKIILI